MRAIIADDEEPARAPEGLPHRRGRCVAVGDHRRGDAAERQPAVVVDLLVRAVVGIEVVRGPDDLVAEVAREFEIADERLHPPLHQRRVVVVVVVGFSATTVHFLSGPLTI